ncbi:MAG: hypothetical protein HYZ94_01165 [Candidatus Omnitrophica bacterium]|nr:hypothetical protein [Candidatus Omnitrophota bacterium]
MPSLEVDKAKLRKFGTIWKKNGRSLSRTPPHSSGELGELFDRAVGKSLAEMLGGIPIVVPGSSSLGAPRSDCVEVGPVRVIGGIRPQNFDVGYRPDGLRFAFDSKTLNDEKSVRKNWQNMINDLATEATTVHSRFPHAVVGFAVVIPEPCIAEAQRKAMIETLERLARRVNVRNDSHMAEAILLVLWNPNDGSIDEKIPHPTSPLRLEKFSAQVEAVYTLRYKGLPPHANG